MPSELAKERLIEILDQIEEFRSCAPGSDPDEETAVVYGFRHLLTAFKRAARSIQNNQTQKDAQAICVPENIYDVFDARAQVMAMVGEIREELSSNESEYASPRRFLSSEETAFWLPGHFRLFVSHVSADKVRAANLKAHLLHYAVSSFIAHEDIEPTKEWQGEIEKALFSMDALIAILSGQFHESKWTDQEAGVALGREVAVLSIRCGLDPYGLIGKYQGIQSVGKTVGEVTKSIMGTLLKNPKTRSRLIACLVEQLLASSNPFAATLKLDMLEKADEITREELTRLRDRAATNAILRDDIVLLQRLNALLKKHGTEAVKIKAEPIPSRQYDIPF